ncbi:MAG TPA: tRNA pseudouridine(38-40) synthase TruA [Candidatus Fimicola cottocaccae]|nr:tRNA pseudouridine(38-40) synthase TruA [Candidatus Fimicola cottocaccae]
MKILLTVAYDGTNYFGWQRQKGDPVVTVEQKIYEACSSLFRKEFEIIGASRTDRGVHALGQRVLLDVDTNIPVERIPRALNSFLPQDIVVNCAEIVSDDFHPRYNCVKKTYIYRIFNGEYRNPLERYYTEFVYKELDVEKMKKACEYFKGTHDFKGFCSAQTEVKSTVRTIFDISVEKINDVVEIYVTGDGFLYNMVRIIAGTLIYVGLSKINPDEMGDIIESCDRTRAGKTAGPEGLTLMKIYY